MKRCGPEGTGIAAIQGRRLSSSTRRLCRSAGVTLVELMVAMAIVTIGVVGLMGTFSFITKSIRISRTRTIAANLAQERIESLKNISYASLLVTTATVTNANFNPAIVYDSVNYPPETILLWGNPTFTRAVYVAYGAPIGNTITEQPYASNDTGLKIVKVHIFWDQDGSWKKVTLTNLHENPSILPLNATISGTVCISPGTGATCVGGSPLSSALVSVVGSPQWRGTTDTSGNYSFQVSRGSYSVTASSTGYRSQTSALLSVGAGASVTQNFTLAAIGSGTVSSIGVYYNPNLVVSQVVSSTLTIAGDNASHDVEYVELFNPTTYPVNIGSGGTPVVRLNYKGQAAGDDQTNIALTYVSTYVAAGQYYLIANATSFAVMGAWSNADAYYNGIGNTALYGDTIKKGKSGAVQITDSGGTIIDGVGWTKGAPDLEDPDLGGSAPWSEGTAITQPVGLKRGDQLVRMSSACTLNASYGRAYDSNGNSVNFFFNTLAAPPNPNYFSYAPRNTASIQTVISGVPATGGYASATDGLSAAIGLTTVFATSPSPWGQSCPYANFTLLGVATGTWTVEVSTGMYSLGVANVAVTQGATTRVLNGATSPADPTGFNHVRIASSTPGGYVSGTVTSGGTPVSGLTVRAGTTLTTTNSSGRYFVSSAAGAVTVTANPNLANPLYVSQSASVSVSLGVVTTQDFALSQGGVLRGYVTSGLAPLPGRVVNADSSTGGTTQGASSDGSGYFYIQNLATGTYAVSPLVEPGESASPASISTTLTTPGTTVSVGTFTISGAFATIKGKVCLQAGAAPCASASKPVTTGVLVIASSAAISSPPPSIYFSTSASVVPYYVVSSQPDGTYSMLVRGSTNYTYNMRAFYPVVNINSGSASYTSDTKTGVSVSPGATLSAQDFRWPE